MKTEYIRKGIKDVAQRLIQVRQNRGYKSWQEFVERHDLPRLQYQRMEEGSHSVTLTFLLQILEIFNMSPAEFFCSDLTRQAV